MVLVNLPISFRITALALGQSYNCPIAIKHPRRNRYMCTTWITRLWWWNNKKIKHYKPCKIFHEWKRYQLYHHWWHRRLLQWQPRITYDWIVQRVNIKYLKTTLSKYVSNHVSPLCCRSIKCRYALQWRDYDRSGVSNHRRLDCLHNGLFRCWSKKTSKLRVTGICEGNSPVTGEFPHKGPVTRKMVPFDDVIMTTCAGTSDDKAGIMTAQSISVDHMSSYCRNKYNTIIGILTIPGFHTCKFAKSNNSVFCPSYAQTGHWVHKV